MMRSIVKSSLRLKSLVLAAAVIVMIAGVVSLDKMPLDVFPEIMPVTVHVQTEALGLSAAEVEQLITVPIEADLLAGTPWVDVMRSESVPGLSSIELIFKRGTNPMHARQMVQERLTQAHALPNVSKPPQMLQPLSSTNRVMLVGLSSETQSLIEMSVLARWTIRPRLMGVPGVANVAIWGQRERQLQVQVDPKRLREKNVSLIQIVKTTGNSLWYSPLSFLESSVAGTGGFIETPNQRIGVRHVLPISVAADLAKVPVEGSSLRLDEVATVVEDHQPLIGDAVNGHGPGLLLVIEKLPGVNTLEVTDEIEEALVALKPGLGGIEFDPNIYRPAGYIRTAISNVAVAFLIALILVVLTFFLLSGSWRSALIGLIAIPISLLTAMMAVFLSGATINVMVMAGLVIALGIVIDDVIAFTVGLRRRMQDGVQKSIGRAILEAASEVRGPLVFATVILLLAAVPLLFVAGAPGAFIKPMVIAYGLAVLASMVVAVTITPALGLLFYRKLPTGGNGTRFSAWVTRTADQMPSFVPRVAFAVAIAATVLGMALMPRHVPTAPTFKERDLLVKWDAMPGTSRAEMNRVLARAGKELRSIPGVRDVGGHVGRAIMSDQVVGIHSSELWVSLKPDADYDAAVAAVEDVVSGYPGVDGDVMTYLRSRFDGALSRVDEPIAIRVYGQDPEILQREAQKVKQAISGIDGIVDPRVHIENSEPVVEIKVDLDAARKYGVKPGDVRRTAATLLAGIEVGNLFENQKVFEVVVWGEPQVRHSVAAIHELLIDTPGGGHVRLGDVAEVRIVPAPQVIQRENVARVIDVVADVKGRDVAQVAAAVNASIQGTRFPLEYRAELMGDYMKQQQAMNRVLWISIGAAVGLLVLLQAAFGSWRLAFAVLVTLPMALAGSAIAAAASGPALSIGSLAGFLTVLGIAVRHGIVVIDRFRRLRRQDAMAFGPDLIRQGTNEQAGPILMSTLVTAAALISFAALGARPGLEILGPMALVILSGLATTMLYTLCVVPALYARFGADALSEVVEDEDLMLPSVPEFQQI